MKFDEDNFPYDPTIKATLSDYLYWAFYNGLLFGAEKSFHYLEDARRAYRHYIENTGTDLTINYLKAYYEDEIIRKEVDNEIVAAQTDAERLSNTAGVCFSMTGEAEKVSEPSTENWQKTIGGHYIWGYADVCACGGRFHMKLTINEKDLYNFNPGEKDIQTGLPDNVNGRFSVLGWAKQFYTNGKFFINLSWDNGKIEQIEKNNKYIR